MQPRLKKWLIASAFTLLAGAASAQMKLAREECPR